MKLGKNAKNCQTLDGASDCICQISVRFHSYVLPIPFGVVSIILLHGVGYIRIGLVLSSVIFLYFFSGSSWFVSLDDHYYPNYGPVLAFYHLCLKWIVQILMTM